MLSEFEIIRRYFTQEYSSAVLGVGDDAALVRLAEGMELAVSTDMLVSGQHFFEDTGPFRLGHKALAVNLSDMAAMGAKPLWATLALALPESLIKTGETWLQHFAAGFFELAKIHHVELVGGDTTCGPLNICVQIMGEVPAGKALRRSGARPGDEIWVSGYLGDAALALAHEQKRIRLEPEEIRACQPALLEPVPRVELGQALIGLAHSAIDISDGLMADLGHILESSGVGAIIQISKTERSAVMKKYLPDSLALGCLLAGGDDYELCFTAPASQHETVVLLGRQLAIPLSCIGHVTAGAGLTVLDEKNESITLAVKGYDHFRT